VFIERGHAHRYGQPDPVAAGQVVVPHRDGQIGDVGTQPLSNLDRVGLTGLRQDDRELVAAEPASQIVAPQLLAQRIGDRAERSVSGQVTIGVVDHLEMVDVDQGHRQRAAGPDGPSDLLFSLGFPGRDVEQPRLVVNAGLGQELGVHHETPGEQHCGYPEHCQDRVPGDYHGEQDAQVHLREVGQQGLAVQRQLREPGGGVGEPDRDHQQGIVPEPADDLAACHADGPGQGVHAAAERRPGDRGRDGPEHHRRRAISQADSRAGEHPAVDEPAVNPPLGHGQQWHGRHQGVDRRKQDRHRQHPHGQEVPHQGALCLACPRGRPDRDQAAAEQQPEGHQVRGAP
jgi:hypothetical protein